MMEKELKAPKLRFPGFTDDWEQRKLGEICEVTMGQSPDGSTYSDEPSDYILVQGNADLKDGWVVPRVWTTQKTKTAQAGDLIMSVRAPAGAMGKTAYDAVIGRGVAAIKGNEFIYQTLVKYDSDGYWKKLAAGSTFESVNSSEVKGAIINIPQDIKEQEKIGEYFSNLDNLITLHQRKLDTLKKLKKGFLQKMFPKNGESVPEIRFPGFTDAWEQRKLSEIAERVTRKNTNLECTLPLTISAQFGLIDQNEFFDKRIAAKDVSGYYIIEKGEFAYNKSTSNDAPWGAIKRLDSYEKGVLSTLYILFRLKNIGSISSNFVATYYETNLWHKGIKEVAAEGARNHGLLNISSGDFFNTVLKLPNSIEEQEKLGSFFSKLDNAITLHQRKLDTLKKFKQGMLQQMFI